MGIRSEFLHCLVKAVPGEIYVFRLFSGLPVCMAKGRKCCSVFKQKRDNERVSTVRFIATSSHSNVSLFRP